MVKIYVFWREINAIGYEWYNDVLFSTGIFAAAQIVLPKDCKGNKFCEIVKMIVGPTAKWYITGHFQWKNIRIATGFANIRIFGGLYFHKLELYVEVSYSCRILHQFNMFLISLPLVIVVIFSRNEGFYIVPLQDIEIEISGHRAECRDISRTFKTDQR